MLRMCAACGHGFLGGLISFVRMVNQDQLACLWMLRVENLCRVGMGFCGGLGGRLILFVWRMNQDQLACLWMLRVENVCFVREKTRTLS